MPILIDDIHVCIRIWEIIRECVDILAPKPPTQTNMEESEHNTKESSTPKMMMIMEKMMMATMMMIMTMVQMRPSFKITGELSVGSSICKKGPQDENLVPFTGSKYEGRHMGLSSVLHEPNMVNKPNQLRPSSNFTCVHTKSATTISFL
nr:hypothetical protein [Tanacetum cinerariifolium]